MRIFTDDYKQAKQMNRQDAWSLVYSLEKDYPTINTSPLSNDMHTVWYVCKVTKKTRYFIS